MENKEDVGPLPFDNLKCREHCISEQAKMLAENEAYRKAKGLEHKYEHNHFICTCMLVVVVGGSSNIHVQWRVVCCIFLTQRVFLLIAQCIKSRQVNALFTFFSFPFLLLISLFLQPSDIEEVHWSNFDATMQGRVREAVEKIYQREKQLNAETLQEELDMGPKEVQ